MHQALWNMKGHHATFVLKQSQIVEPHEGALGVTSWQDPKLGHYRLKIFP